MDHLCEQGKALQITSKDKSLKLYRTTSPQGVSHNRFIPLESKTTATTKASRVKKVQRKVPLQPTVHGYTNIVVDYNV